MPYRTGQGHHRAVLTDFEVEALLSEREAGATYSLLAARYGVSKSCVAGICKARRRAVAHYAPRVIPKTKRVRVDLRLSLRARNILHRLGGGRFLESLAVRMDCEIARTPDGNAQAAWLRVIGDTGGVKS